MDQCLARALAGARAAAGRARQRDALSGTVCEGYLTEVGFGVRSLCSSGICLKVPLSQFTSS